MNSCEIITHILLLQKASKYPEAHPSSQCPLIELQETLCKQFPLQWLVQSGPNVPFSQPVVRNYNADWSCKQTVTLKKYIAFSDVIYDKPVLYSFYSIQLIKKMGE